MSTINSLGNAVLQSALQQVLGQTGNTGSTTSTTTSSSTSNAGSTTVSLGNTPPTGSITYNAAGKLSSSQVSALEQAISKSAGSTVNALFNQTSSSSAGSSSLSQLLNTGSASGSGNSSLASLISLVNGAQTSNASTTQVTQAQATQDVLNAQQTLNNTMSSLLYGNSSNTGSSNSSLASLFSLSTPTALQSAGISSSILTQALNNQPASTTPPVNGSSGNTV